MPGTSITKSLVVRDTDPLPTDIFQQFCAWDCERTIAARSINPTAFDHKSFPICHKIPEIIRILKMTSPS